MSDNVRHGSGEGAHDAGAFAEGNVHETVGAHANAAGSNPSLGANSNAETNSNQGFPNQISHGSDTTNAGNQHPLTNQASGSIQHPTQSQSQSGSTFGSSAGSAGSTSNSGNPGSWDSSATSTTGTSSTGSGSGTSWGGDGSNSGSSGTTSGGTTFSEADNVSTTPGNFNASTSTPASNVKLGKGLDIGTANLVSAVQNEQGGITIRMERNAFIDIESDVYSKRMLTKLQVPYVVHNDRMVVLGDSAFELSNIFSRETRRPMKDGLISPSEVDALGIIRMIIEKILGLPQGDGEKCYFSIPAASIDRPNNVIYHQGLFDGLLRKMGYVPHPMNEAHAVVFSELAEQNFTGIGISCGGGMFNVCVAYKTIPALTFSICRGGDWIDSNVANVLGIPSSKATAVKERGCDLMNPRNREEEAVVIYYRNLINYTLMNIKQKFEVAQDMPEFPEPIDIVFSGGTSMVGGFAELCDQELKKIHFPIPVNRVRRAKDPLSSVARGCLIAAAIGE